MSLSPAQRLEVKDLVVRYGPVEAVRSVSFTVEPGKIACLIGSNGAGKTSTLRGVSRMVKASGVLRYGDTDLTKCAPHQLPTLGIAHVPEGRGVLAPLTIEENLRLAAWTVRNKKLELDRMEEGFALFPRLKERRHQPAGTLSGGEQQMLALARALMVAPRLMLLDEPSMGLSPKLVEEVFRILADLNKKGIGILLVEQNAHAALQIADMAYVLENGSIVRQGSGNELLGDASIHEAYLGG